MNDGDGYELQRREAQAVYAAATPTLSPALGERAAFTAEGFNHIVFTGARRERERASQLMRFTLLPRALRLIARSTTFQEYEETVKEVEVKVRKRRTRELRPVRYWGIIAIFENRKIKVILRKIGNGQLHFWSVVPAWTTNKYRDTKFITTMKGNPRRTNEKHRLGGGGFRVPAFSLCISRDRADAPQALPKSTMDALKSE